MAITQMRLQISVFNAIKLLRLLPLFKLALLAVEVPRQIALPVTQERFFLCLELAYFNVQMVGGEIHRQGHVNCAINILLQLLQRIPAKPAAQEIQITVSLATPPHS